MTEEPYRWLEAIANRREYVQEQLRGGLPAFAVSTPKGIFLAAPGEGGSKVFEIHDRIAMLALGHPADIEKVRQVLIDSAHVEAFARSSADVSLQRLVASVLAPALKQNFEQLFSPPFLVELLLLEVGVVVDTFIRLRPDGSFAVTKGPAGVLWNDLGREAEAIHRLAAQAASDDTVETLVQRVRTEIGRMSEAAVDPVQPSAGIRSGVYAGSLETAILERYTGNRSAAFQSLAS